MHEEATAEAVYGDSERCSIHQNVHFFICSKTGILNDTAFKHSLHKFRETNGTPKITIS